MSTTTTSTAAPADTSCAAFRRLSPDALRPDAVHRFVVGEDTAVRVLSASEAADELGDPFAQRLLLQGIFPRTAGGVLEALDRASPEGDPLRKGFIFLVGEGSQIPMSPATADVQRRLRFLVARGLGADGADVLMSAFSPDEGDVEVMAWDARSGGFNFYQTVGQSSAWVFAGNSRHALAPPTRGKGPFESHLSGTFVMKELRFPWVHWHSQAANILPSVLPADPPLTGHPWVTGRDPKGALTCEIAVAKPGIRRWARVRFERLLAEGGVVDHPAGVMEQVLTTPSVNLISSQRESRAAQDGADVDLPQTFFVDSEALTEVLGLRPPPQFVVASGIYADNLDRFDVHLSDGRGFRQAGDAHFAFVVPERAFEDRVVLEQALEVGLLTRRLAACLLMTDFPNPVFSHRRASLLRHVPDTAVVHDGASTFSEQMADAITAAASGTADGSAEREFARRWEVGEDFAAAFDDELGRYYAAIEARLKTPDGYDAYVRLAESRRERVRSMPVFETPLLFAQAQVARQERSMGADGAVTEG